MGKSSNEPCQLLVVEDDIALRVGLIAIFEREGYAVDAAPDGEHALQLLSDRKRHLQLVVLDLMLPGIDGLAVLKHLRRTREDLPVLVLSAKGTTHDKVSLLDAGADDYLLKPFETDELLARVRVLLKRYGGESGPMAFGDVSIDLSMRHVLRSGSPVTLSATQFKILEALLARPGATISRDQILDRVWGLDLPESPRVVDYHILQIRRKLEATPDRPKLIVTVPGLGYRISVANSLE